MDSIEFFTNPKSNYFMQSYSNVFIKYSLVIRWYLIIRNLNHLKWIKLKYIYKLW